MIGQADAQKQGLTHYFTGKSCKHGHVASRYVKGGHCVECTRLREQNDAERILANSKAWNRRNKHPLGENI